MVDEMAGEITWEILKLASTTARHKKMPSLPPWETSNYHSPITKHLAKQKIRNSIQMQSGEPTSTLTNILIYIKKEQKKAT